MNLPTGFLSVSQIRTYLRCPQQYEYIYLRKLRPPATSSLLIGRSFHKAIEEANRAKLETGEILELENVLDVFNDTWEREKSDVEWGDEDQGKAKDSGLIMTSHYYQEAGQHLKPAMIEQELSVDIGGVPFKVIIDLVERGGIIRDFKTAKRTPPADEADKSIQLTAYAIAYRELTGEEEAAAALDYTVNLKNGPKVVRLETKIGDDRIERTERLIKGVAQSISAGMFYPVEEGFACSFCSFKDICKGGS